MLLEQVSITKLVHGGQGLGVLPDGRKVFVWNALPGEQVSVRITKKRKDYAEGIAEEILKASPERVEPIDEAYLSTSPWQILDFNAENKYKKEILTEVFAREKVDLPEFEFVTEGELLHYRNKMEYSFWGGKPPAASSSGLQSPISGHNLSAARQRTNGYASSQQTDSVSEIDNFAAEEKQQVVSEDGLHLALYHRASHSKRIVTGSSIARPEIDEAASKILAILNKNGIRASQLKTVIVRVNKKGETVAALFVKDQSFPGMDLGGICRGVAVYFSNPKSPASIVTRELYRDGEIHLDDDILGTNISYDVNSFFQVNLPVFERALEKIKGAVEARENVIDMYAGVGAIGLATGSKVLVELDAHNIEMAKQNAGDKAEVVQASTEKALDYIESDSVVIFDPPRAGLHDKVTERLLAVKPPKIVYLSCNPATQARDVARLQETYAIVDFTGYNFFPRTPHIESLVILERK
jgi:23S rRNA (uracil1939-C5)-methyltransferase